jgi:hypothetical protein
MTTIRRSVRIDTTPDHLWEVVRDIGALHTRLVPGFVVNTELEPGARVVTFANGMVTRELIVSVDDEARRVCWSARNEHLVHHNAAFEVRADGDTVIGVWTADVLPDTVAPVVAGMIEEGLAAMQRTFAHRPPTD